MDTKFARREKLVFEWIGRILLFLLGVTFIVLPDKFPPTSLLGLICYESLGIAICGVDFLFAVGCILRAYNWCEPKNSNLIRYVGFEPTNKSGGN